MSSIVLSSRGFDMPYGGLTPQSSSRVQYSAIRLAKTVTAGHSVYFSENGYHDLVWQILDDLLNAFRIFLNQPERASLIRVDSDITKLLEQLNQKDYSKFSAAEQPFIDYLEKVHVELLNLIDRMAEGNFSSKDIATFDSYANKVHGWHSRLSDRIDPEMQELMRLTATIRPLK